MSTVGDILSTVGVFSTVGDIMINVGNILSTVGVFSTMGDIMSTVAGYFEYCGGYSVLRGYHEYHGVSSTVGDTIL